MKKGTTSAAIVRAAIVEDALQDVRASFERSCLTAGITTLASMMEEDAVRLCGPRRRQERLPLKQDQGKGRLPWRQGRDRAAACPRS